MLRVFLRIVGKCYPATLEILFNAISFDQFP